MTKSTDFQVDYYKRFEPAMKKQKIHSVPFIADPKKPLAPDEREIIAEFEEKIFKAANERSFKIGL